MSLQPRSVYRSDAAECPKIDYYQADLILNKHDSMATADALAQVFNCNPSLDPQRDLNMAENTVASSARRVLILGQQDVLATYATIGEFVRRMATLPGQRTLILVSPGFFTTTPEALTAESRIIDFAATSNVNDQRP
jgi:hypothetical protein